jgi:hypothetical protein
MDPAIYKLIKTSVFTVPPNPGNIPTYPQFDAIQNIKMANHVWENVRNYYLSYINISSMCFQMDKLVPNHSKVSNDPALLGWNPTTSIQMIMVQL